MALDVGTKSIGVAVSDPLKLIARPLTTLWRRNLADDVREVEKLVRRNRVEKLILGQPRHLDGRRSETMTCVARLAGELKRVLSIPMEYFDERLSTRAAEEVMSRMGLPVSERRRRRNEFAAALILKWHLEEGG